MISSSMTSSEIPLIPPPSKDKRRKGRFNCSCCAIGSILARLRPQYCGNNLYFEIDILDSSSWYILHRFPRRSVSQAQGDSNDKNSEVCDVQLLPKENHCSLLLRPCQKTALNRRISCYRPWPRLRCVDNASSKVNMYHPIGEFSSVPRYSFSFTSHRSSSASYLFWFCWWSVSLSNYMSRHLLPLSDPNPLLHSLKTG